MISRIFFSFYTQMNSFENPYAYNHDKQSRFPCSEMRERIQLHLSPPYLERSHRHIWLHCFF